MQPTTAEDFPYVVGQATNNGIETNNGRE